MKTIKSDQEKPKKSLSYVDIEGVTHYDTYTIRKMAKESQKHLHEIMKDEPLYQPTNPKDQ